MRWAKQVVIVLMLATAAAVLAFGPRQQHGVPAGVVVVDYWEKWTGPEGAQMASIVDDFNRTVGQQKHIYVRIVTTSNIDKKTLVAVAGGVPPDLAGMWDPQLVQFAAQGALMPLDQLAAEHGITAATYKKVYWDACHWDGHLYALVSTPATIALVYNKAAFRDSADQLRAAGLDPERPPRTMDELDRYAKAVERKDPAGRLTRSGILPAAAWYLYVTPYWYGGDVWDPAARRFTLTSQACVKTFEWVQSYSRRLGAKSVTDFKTGMGNFDSPQNPFLAGTEVMQQQGPWMANFILSYRPSMFGVPDEKGYDTKLPAAQRKAMCEWGAAPFPQADGLGPPITYAAFDTLIIPKGAKHPREAFEFAAYVNTQPVMEKLNNMHSKNSPLAAVSDDFLQHHKNPYIDVWDDLARSPNARGIPQVPIWPEAEDEIAALVQRLVLNPDLPVKPALAELQDRLQGKYDRFMEMQAARATKS